MLKYLSDNNFLASFEPERLYPLILLVADYQDKSLGVIKDKKMRKLIEEVVTHANSLTNLTSTETFTMRGNPSFNSVPVEWVYKDKERYNRVKKGLHESSSSLYKALGDFVSYCESKHSL